MSEIVIGIIVAVVGIIGTFVVMNKKLTTAEKVAGENLTQCLWINNVANTQIQELQKRVEDITKLAQQAGQKIKLADSVFVEVVGTLKCENNPVKALDIIKHQWRDIPVDCGN